MGTRLVKQQVKGWMYAAAPRWTTAFMSARSRAHSQKLMKEWGCLEINDRLVERLGSAVLSGPFKGLELSPMARAEHAGPFLLGVYESELDPAWGSVFAGDYPQVIDVGAKFGFYAVGLALRYPKADVVAFDTDWWARRAVREMAAANRVENVRVLGFCDAAWLAAHLREGAFILSDCEGYEGELFGGPTTIPALATATLIVETHEMFAPGVYRRLRDKFAATHEVHEVGSEAVRRVSDLPLEFLDPAQRALANKEVRPDQVWLLCLPRSGPNGGLKPPAASSGPAAGPPS